MEIRQNNSTAAEVDPDENPRAVIEEWLATREERERRRDASLLAAERQVEKARKSVERLKRSVGLE
jgi:hypothetical protein